MSDSSTNSSTKPAVTPLDLILAQAATLRQQALAIVQGVEALLITCDSIQMRAVGAEGAPAVPFLMGQDEPTRPATAPAEPPAIPTQGRRASDAQRPFLTFDSPVAPRPAQAPITVDELKIAPDATGDLRPTT